MLDHLILSLRENVIFEYFYMLGTVSGALLVFSPLITRTVMEDRYYHCHSHFTDKETDTFINIDFFLVLKVVQNQGVKFRKYKKVKKNRKISHQPIT